MFLLGHVSNPNSQIIHASKFLLVYGEKSREYVSGNVYLHVIRLLIHDLFHSSVTLP